MLALEPLREAEAYPQQEADAVKLLTVHAAKGLEFHTVFIADVRNKRFRKDNAFLLEIPPASDAPGPGRIVAKRLPGFRKESEEYNEFLEKRDAKARHDQEERRIFYVALTRAKENLYLTPTADSANFFDELASEFANCKRVEINPTRESQ